MEGEGKRPIEKGERQKKTGVTTHMEMQGGHNVVTIKVVALSQGCFKLVTALYKIPRLSQVLSQGCHKVVKGCYTIFNYNYYI